MSERFPVLTDAEVATVLRTAAEMIAAGYRREVRFVAAAAPATQPAGEYFAQLRRRLDPYVPDDSFDPFKGKLEQAAPAFLGAVREAGDLSRLHQFLGKPEPFADEAAAAAALREAYARRVAKLKSLRRDGDGAPRLDPATYEQASLPRWDLYLASTGPKAEYDLVLFNGLLVEEPAGLASFHTLATAVANGTAFPVANNCAVGYFPLLSGDPDVRADRLGPLSADERLAAIAYVVAHEVGTHLIMLRRDDYSPDAGLARPIFALTDKADVLGYRAWRPPTAEPRPIDEVAFRARIALTRLGVAAARGELEAFDAELEALLGLPLDEAWKGQVVKWAARLRGRAAEVEEASGK